MYYISGCLDEVKSSNDEVKMPQEILEKLTYLQMQVAFLTQELGLLRKEQEDSKEDNNLSYDASPSTFSSELPDDEEEEDECLLDDGVRSNDEKESFNHGDYANDIIDSYFDK